MPDERDPGAPSSPLRQAVLAHDAERVARALAEGGDPNERRDGVTLFESALRKGRYDDVILALYDGGGDIARVSPKALNLVWAVGTRREDVVSAFLAAGAEADVDSFLVSPVGLAARHGDAAIVSLLIEAGAPLDRARLQGTPLAEAIGLGHAECARLLLEAGVAPHGGPLRGDRLAPLAARQGMAEVLRLLLRAGADAEARETVADCDEERARERIEGALRNALSEGGGSVALMDPDEWTTRYRQATPLILAAGEGHRECVEVLVEAGVDLAARDDDGLSAVEHACRAGHGDIADRLVAAGAPSGATNDPGLALRRAAQAGDVASIDAALRAGAPLEAPDPREEHEGRTALMLAAQGGHGDAIEALLAAGADPNRSDAPDGTAKPNIHFMMRGDARGRTALSLAAAEGHADATARLLVAGADPDLRDAEDATALLLAAGRGHADVVRVLAEAGVDLDQRGAERTTPLLEALSDQHMEAASALIDAGADVNLWGDDGQTPLHAAALFDDRRMVERLLAAGADPTQVDDCDERPRDLTDSEILQALLEQAERDWELRLEAEDASGGGSEGAVPRLGALAERYAPHRVVERLRAACEEPSFRAALPEIAERCGGEARDECEEIGGYTFDVSAGRLDVPGLEELQAEMLERGVLVFCCAPASAGDAPGRLAALPSRDPYDALGVWSTGESGHRPPTELIRGLREGPETVLTWIQGDELRGRCVAPDAEAASLLRLGRDGRLDGDGRFRLWWG